MAIEAVSSGTVAPRQHQAAEQVNRMRDQQKNEPEEIASAENSNKIQPEELLQEIKSITENGLYSVRFENNDNDNLVVKVVDRNTNEVIRQIPPEELMELTKRLEELKGNIVNTVT